MKLFRYINTAKRLLQFRRPFSCFSDDPGGTFKKKGLAEENRYFSKKQKEELIRLHKQLETLNKQHDVFQEKLKDTHKLILDIVRDSIEEKRKKEDE